jgi:hypothetical protein
MKNGLSLEATGMTKFQKIAVGLLGLTHPEMFTLRFRPDSKSPTEAPPASLIITAVRRGDVLARQFALEDLFPRLYPRT